MAYPLPSDAETQAHVADLISTGDLDLMIPTLDPRIEALIHLADWARSEGGGTLDEEVHEAAEVLALTLAGRGRWDVISNWNDANLRRSTERRHTLVSEQIEQILKDEGIGLRIRARILGGE